MKFFEQKRSLQKLMYLNEFRFFMYFFPINFTRITHQNNNKFTFFVSDINTTEVNQSIKKKYTKYREKKSIDYPIRVHLTFFLLKFITESIQFFFAF